jgi:hypothetical protein
MSSMYGQGPTRYSSQQPMRGGTGNISGYKTQQLQQFTPEQMQLFQSLFGHLGPESYLGRLAGGDEDIFKEIESPALQQFSGELGNLASRFSQGAGGRGSLGSRRSSGFQNAGSQAASQFAQQLQSQRQGLQQNAIKDLLGMSNQLLGQRPYETILTPKSGGFLQNLLGSLAGGLGQGLGGGIGGLFGKLF